ncbi:hypothetical protein [Frankia sp. QA3]|uniref:hypothetical protein n=1 Tax=Frankia sp. QA3 TaxID=710111 RepID=UPI0012F9409F|nr:hypothetical protein [Frankia sp. QA3]
MVLHLLDGVDVRPDLGKEPQETRVIYRHVQPAVPLPDGWGGGSHNGRFGGIELDSVRGESLFGQCVDCPTGDSFSACADDAGGAGMPVEIRRHVPKVHPRE